MANKEIFLYLDLNGKLDYKFFQKQNIHFKMVNINTESPLVQIGNYVFQGTYEDFLGTKVFFTEDKNRDPSDNVFINESPIHLKYMAKTAKVLQLKWRRIPTSTAAVDIQDCTDLQFTENYSKVLDKFENHTLNLQDIIYNSSRENLLKTSEKPVQMQVDITPTSEVKMACKTENNVDDENEKIHPDSDKYKLLKEVAIMPAKQSEFQKVYEIKKDHLAAAEDAKNFSVLKQLFLQDILLKNEAFRMGNNEFNKYVDVEQSVKDGVIDPLENDVLSDKQKHLLLGSNNFDNFSLPMKLAYLTEQLDEYKRLLQEKRGEDADEYGRTFKDRYRLLKRLTKEIWYYVYSNSSDYM